MLDKGTKELINFLEKVELDIKWIQDKGDGKEHYDLLGRTNFDKAIENGASLVDREVIGAFISLKKQYYRDRRK
jgi:hypothetical protein